MKTVKYPNVSVNLTGRDGNAFVIIGTVRRALVKAGKPEAAKEWADAATACGSYDDLLRLAMATVDVN